MQELKIPILVTDEDYFLKLLTHLKSEKKLSELRLQELQVFSELVACNFKYKDLDAESRGVIVFGNNLIKHIATKYSMPIGNIYNIRTSLDDKGMISLKDKKINPTYCLNKIDRLIFEFKHKE